MKRLLFTLITVYIVGAHQNHSFRARPSPGDQKYGRYEIRKGANLFYWLYYTEANYVLSPYKNPLVIWLSKDPRFPSSSYGNFNEIGPILVNGTKRPTSWVNYVNLLFLDTPVGAGFSNVSDEARLAITNEEAAADVLEFLIRFYDEYPDFRDTPMYIFGELYGGRLAVEVAKQLDAAIKEERLSADFKGIAIGAPWISPIDSCMSQARSSKEKGFCSVIYGKLGMDTRKKLGMDIWKVLEKFGISMDQLTTGNEKHTEVFPKLLSRSYAKKNDVDLHSDLFELMNKVVKKALFEIPDDTLYNEKGLAAYIHLFPDFAKPVTSVVEYLLKNTNINVTIYNGEFAFYLTTKGTLRWINKLEWSGRSEWHSAEENPLIVNGEFMGTIKNYGNLFFYEIKNAGLEVPKNNPEAGIEILRRVTEFDKPDLNVDDKFPVPIEQDKIMGDDFFGPDKSILDTEDEFFIE